MFLTFILGFVEWQNKSIFRINSFMTAGRLVIAHDPLGTNTYNKHPPERWFFDIQHYVRTRNCPLLTLSSSRGTWGLPAHFWSESQSLYQFSAKVGVSHKRPPPNRSDRRRTAAKWLWTSNDKEELSGLGQKDFPNDAALQMHIDYDHWLYKHRRHFPRQRRG